ncbi:LnmK family bifunctional acyltransferase/decarboxylase [Sphingomonas tabacisoli]|uniref:LnmK family bifunctional acyltransferase/decarboxylase n=1 Tax=Sphingomonas tabacisoli TaxID=2249466 RepID=A0ABW4HXA5_9SPHN
MSRFSVAKLRRKGMRIGEGVMLSRHARLDNTNPRGVHIGDYTALAPACSILTHDFVNNRHIDTYIGSNCFIGTGAVVLAGVRIGDHCVVAAGSVVMSDVPSHSMVMGVPARIVRSGVVTGRWGIMADDFLAVESERGRLPVRPAAPAGGDASSLASKLSPDQLLEVLRTVKPDASEANLAADIDALGIDSFGFINVRVALEAALGRPIPESLWGSLTRLDQLLANSGEVRQQAPAAASFAAPAAQTLAPEARPAGESRTYTINMPQMALRGLAEPWLMKELGDLHWSILMRELRTTSGALADTTGARLYATFTRIRYRSDAPLTDYRENERLTMSIAEQRYGAAMFFGSGIFEGARGKASVDIMSTFSKYGEAGANTSLLKGQPDIPDGCAIPSITELPEFGQEYRALRASDFGPVLAETGYDLLPVHDINGVGLLYFAAYPSIAELCLTRLKGKWFAFETSLIARDICYFANADPDEELIFRLHDWTEVGDDLSYVATLSRASDGHVMARIAGTKRRVTLPPAGLPVTAA